jgi:hypothetical protein
MMEELKIGDIVTCIDTGGFYYNYRDFFISNNMEEYIEAWNISTYERPHGKNIRKNEDYYVLNLGWHRDKTTKIAVLMDKNEYLYLMSCSSEYLMINKESKTIFPEFRIDNIEENNFEENNFEKLLWEGVI